MISGSRIRRWVVGLIPAELLTRLVIFGACAEFGFGMLASPYLGAGSRFFNVLSYLLAALASFGVLSVIYLFLRERVSEASLRWVLIIAIPVIDALCGAALAWGRYASELDPSPLWLLRIMSTVVNVGASTLLLWMAASGIRNHYQRLDTLMEERGRLEALRSEALYDLDALKAEATEAVRSRILHDLESSGSLDGQRMLAALTSTIEETVRPISRQLESSAPAWIPPEPEFKSRERIDWIAVALNGASVKRMNPWALLIILSAIAAPMNLYRVGIAFSLEFLVLTFLIALPTYLGIRRIFMRIAGDAQGIAGVIAFIAMCVVSGIAWGLATLVITWDTSRPLRFLILCPLFTLIYGYILGMAIAAQDQAAATESALRDATDELRWSVARKRELHRQRKQALAHAVHGRVQAALAAGILEIERELQSEEITDARIREIHARIAECVQELDLQENTPLEASRIIDKVRATWAGVLELSMSIEPSLELALARDQQSLVTLNDLIPELVFNSIKHGSATHAQINLDFVDERTFGLVVEDDGMPQQHKEVAGMGSHLLDTCAIRWSRTRSAGRTVTSALLPIAGGDNGEFRGFPLKSKSLADAPS